jgi:electron transfer flavoprotein alpha subunit
VCSPVLGPGIIDIIFADTPRVLFCSSASTDTSTRYFTMLPLARQPVLRAARSQLKPSYLTSASRSSFLARLASTLALLEQRDGKLNSGSLGAVTAGRKIGGTVTGFLAGKNAKTIAEEASKVEGLDKILVVENEAYERGLPENWAPLLVENIKKGGFTHVVVGHSAFGKNLLPRVAALLDVQQISDIMGIESEDSMFSNTLIYSLQTTNAPQLLSAQSTPVMPS